MRGTTWGTAPPRGLGLGSLVPVEGLGILFGAPRLRGVRRGRRRYKGNRRRRIGNRGRVLYRLAAHRRSVELRRSLNRHRGCHVRSIGVRRHKRRAASSRLGAVRVASRRWLWLESGRHRVAALAVTVSVRVRGRIACLGVVRRIVGVESSTTSAVVEAATVGTGHTLVAHVAGTRHGDIRALPRVQGLVVKSRVIRGDRRSHVALRKRNDVSRHIYYGRRFGLGSNTRMWR